MCAAATKQKGFGRFWTNQKIVELEALHSQGLPPRLLAAVFHVSQSAIRSQCSRMGLRNKSAHNSMKYIGDGA